MHSSIVNIYAGFDPRVEVGFHTFCSSVIHHSSLPVRITPLGGQMLRAIWKDPHTDGTNEFTYLRWLIPWLQDWKGWALYVDGADMVCLDDIAELWALRDDYMAVQVVKHAYKTTATRKYIGTDLEAPNTDYPCKNWSSVMLMNCGSFAWRDLTPDTVAEMSGPELHRFGFMMPSKIGALPIEWNWMPQEFGPREDAGILHFTLGIPAFAHYRNCAQAGAWFEARDRMLCASAT